MLFSPNLIVAEDITVIDGEGLIEEMSQMTRHRFSFSFSGGPLDGNRSVGDEHPTIIEGELADWWPNFLRDNVWGPLNFGVSSQWILLGMMVGTVMGTAGAQARSMFTMLTPTSRTAEFFGFYGFIGKAAAVIGPIVYAICAATMGSRMGLVSVIFVIIMGWVLFIFVDLEEGIEVAKRADAEAVMMSETD